MYNTSGRININICCPFSRFEIMYLSPLA